MLKCETNTPEVEADIRAAFMASDEAETREATDDELQLEHGQWWVTHKPTGAQWSVNDLNEDDFCFEQVTQGDEE